tara:strand:+ start:1037 stop:1258 length:222 start_codon:yes stop_codon:yes gene_type:complete
MKYLGIIRDQLVDDLKEIEAQSYVSESCALTQASVLKRYIKIVDEMILVELEVKADKDWITEILEVSDEDSKS